MIMPVPPFDKDEDLLKSNDKNFKYQPDESCQKCGQFTLVRCGTCVRCDTCGETSGCS